MEIRTYPDKSSTGTAAALHGAHLVNMALSSRGQASVVLATGSSQFEMLDALVTQPVDWSRVTVFHLDEYIGLADTHPASFRKYLRDRFVGRIPRLRAFHAIDGNNPNPAAECERLAEIVAGTPIDVGFLGIGENGHLAFNDPPADFRIDAPYLVVNLDRTCRRQQLGEGWFSSLDEVPMQAVSMSIGQIMKCGAIVCTVPEERKARAVCNALEGPVTNLVPASILQRHPNCRMCLDEAAAGLLAERH